MAASVMATVVSDEPGRRLRIICMVLLGCWLCLWTPGCADEAITEIELRVLTVTLEGSGHGRVSSVPGGIDCGAHCARDYESGTVITLTAEAEAGSEFAQWGGGCHGTDTTCRVTLESDTEVVAVFALQPCVAQSDIPLAECDALAALFKETNGWEWTDNTDWLETASPCSWTGVTCRDGSVTELYLFSNNLAGKIPPELGNLKNLEWLHLGSNQLEGRIPPELGNLDRLKELRLRINRLTGEIPPELGNLVNLESLQLDSNQVAGIIPPELGNLKKLEWLNLRANQLTGMPPELGNLERLQFLWIGRNQLSGTIPPELASLASLRHLSLKRNQLTGTIPRELGNLAGLEWLQLGHNQLEGIIPAELATAGELTLLDLQHNQLSGTIPPELGNLDTLTFLVLGHNQLSGAIPPEIGALRKLEVLHLGNNQLTGTIPPELGSLEKLGYLALGQNQLGGLLPLAVAELGGQIEYQHGEDNCVFVPGNDDLYMPDKEDYRQADLAEKGMICGLWFTPVGSHGQR